MRCSSLPSLLLFLAATVGLMAFARSEEAVASGAARAPASAPNVLFISLDDLNDWVGCLGGHPQARTPNLDRLATSGILFENAHCPAPACNPCRSAVMTGIAGIIWDHQESHDNGDSREQKHPGRPGGDSWDSRDTGDSWDKKIPRGLGGDSWDVRLSPTLSTTCFCSCPITILLGHRCSCPIAPLLSSPVTLLRLSPIVLLLSYSCPAAILLLLSPITLSIYSSPFATLLLIIVFKGIQIHH